MSTSGNQKSKHHYKRILQTSVSIILTIGFLFIAFRDVNFSDVLKILSNASLFWIFLMILSVMTSHFLRAVRWKVILYSVKPGASLKNLFGALMVGYGVNCIIPRLGEISRAVLAGKWEGLSRSSMFGTVIVERVIDTIFLCIAVFISIVIGTEDISVKFPWLKTALYISMAALFAAIVTLIFLIRFREKFYGIIVRYFGKFSDKLGHKIAYIFNMLTAGFSSLKGIKNYSITIILSIIIMLFYSLSAYIGFFTIGMENFHPVNFGMAWILMSISAIGVVIPTPGATGSYHALAKSTLVLLFGFGESISLAYAILTHIISYFLFIITSLLFFFIINRQHENLIKVVETELDEL